MNRTKSLLLKEETHVWFWPGKVVLPASPASPPPLALSPSALALLMFLEGTRLRCPGLGIAVSSAWTALPLALPCLTPFQLTGPLFPESVPDHCVCRPTCAPSPC